MKARDINGCSLLITFLQTFEGSKKYELMTKLHASYEKNLLKIPIFYRCIAGFCCQCVSPELNEIKAIKVAALSYRSSILFFFGRTQSSTNQFITNLNCD
ncbi:hypothetical protein Psal006b_00166 [Piscirickettsia salmonis]|uniref:Uncharacterized protein n=1 Tax=Piscirickettsia salmonis TaxID=1238 RepID=A0A1L6TF95_PISSA|nr:hypothetical protein [Piscirickettsia salmonis]ALT18725.1 hypothetical protein PSLF89_07855 [Piscirickettsia salmonis LF-89 = ATCC VR-1361]ALB24181.1 hypothetical protein KU39_3008 [Piscirickettsia salmonis]ALY03982.1 hypothetical protein AWE47_14855 [Piscirickettsia salmonis]AMA43546.1 hypothetical protein AWJ11_15080 [Piscirickettsia salmonis]AOS36015.1 hypothetical protein AVM72_12195 [Piscirickettsia salmonis]